ncbi:hypothetical protein DPMN_138297 [Dreissena polymorpha]|uniref:Uncharacterized protein n=1 Tax=Dreissena polymorpha TaxID=45954 RepID=A0A9D4JFH3_DREPO|nr:hypothetical protein DPMN_138297 [Dreissena polymorpha]
MLANLEQNRAKYEDLLEQFQLQCWQTLNKTGQITRTFWNSANYKAAKPLTKQGKVRGPTGTLPTTRLANIEQNRAKYENLLEQCQQGWRTWSCSTTQWTLVAGASLHMLINVEQHVWLSQNRQLICQEQ